MKKSYCIAILMLIISVLASNACAISETEDATVGNGQNGDQVDVNQAATYQVPSPSTVALSLYVIERKGTGIPLSGVAVTAYDAAGNMAIGVTSSNEPLVIDGQPGMWQFTMTKEGYRNVSLAYEVTNTSTAIAAVERINQSPETVALTIHVHDGDLNGTPLADVQVSGQDFGGNGFESMTDSNGAVVIDGVPGIWQFTFAKEGYETLSLSYNVTETQNTGAYLLKAADLQENPAPAPSNQ
jgi:predicted secreted protein